MVTEEGKLSYEFWTVRWRLQHKAVRTTLHPSMPTSLEWQQALTQELVIFLPSTVHINTYNTLAKTSVRKKKKRSSNTRRKVFLEIKLVLPMLLNFSFYLILANWWLHTIFIMLEVKTENLVKIFVPGFFLNCLFIQAKALQWQPQPCWKTILCLRDWAS